MELIETVVKENSVKIFHMIYVSVRAQLSLYFIILF